MRVNPGTWIIVADGEKYLVLTNDGTRMHPDLRVVSHDEIANPPTRDQISDRPGRMPDAGASGSRSAMEVVDWHRLQKELFAKNLAERMGKWADEGRFKELIVVAARRTLGELRDGYSDKVRERLAGEIGKDLTNATVADIEAALSAA
jgi:protein required for attachment to host cells